MYIYINIHACADITGGSGPGSASQAVARARASSGHRAPAATSPRTTATQSSVAWLACLESNVPKELRRPNKAEEQLIQSGLLLRNFY